MDFRVGCKGGYKLCYVQGQLSFLPCPEAVSIFPRFVVVDRLWYTEVKKPDADSSCEQHRKIGDIVILWLVIVLAQLQVAVLREVQNDDENHPKTLCADIKPRWRHWNPTFRRGHHTQCLAWPNYTPNYKRPYDQGREQSHDGIQGYPYWTNLRFKRATFRFPTASTLILCARHFVRRQRQLIAILQGTTK